MDNVFDDDEGNGKGQVQLGTWLGT